MTGDTGDMRQRVLLLTGLLGAGKTTALRALEDLGWEVVDNFPIRLLDRLLATKPAERPETPAPLAIGFDSRTRDFDPTRIISQVRRYAGREDLAISTLFLDCSESELERRYNETRRRHPMAKGVPAAAGIAAERELMEPLRSWADTVLETSAFTVNDLQQAIRDAFGKAGSAGPQITVSSFGFSRGMPPIADLVFDMRFLDNPHWVDELRPLTGKDEPVADYIRRDPAWEEAFVRIRDLLVLLLGRYAAQGKAYVNIAFGCTGGRHRSVFIAEQIAQSLREAGFSPTLLHRNLASVAKGAPDDVRQS